MRVLISGMGGQLGTLVARRLESFPEVEAIAGYDLDPPRRRLRRSTFKRISPRDAQGVADYVRATRPTVVVHLGVYEPHARLTPKAAHAATIAGADALVNALDSARDVKSVIVRSGIEVYGRRRGGPIVPDERAATDPTTAFGRSQLRVEEVFAALGSTRGIPVSTLRFATVAGSHTPSPLARILRLGLVPVPALSEPTFALVHADDAIGSIVAAVQHRPDGAVNVVGPGAVSAYQAAHMGGHLSLPLFGPGWKSVRWLAEMAGAPLPEHVREQLVRGRCAAGARCSEVLGMEPLVPADQVVAEIQDFPTVEYLTVDAA